MISTEVIRGYIDTLKKLRHNLGSFEVIGSAVKELAENSKSSSLTVIKNILYTRIISRNPTEVKYTESAIPKISSSVPSQSQLQDVSGNNKLKD